MMQNSITKIFFAFICQFFAMLMFSCSDEMASVVSESESETTVSFVFNVTDAKDSVKGGSRTVSSDNSISDIAVFIFDQNGNAIGKGKASNATSLKVMTRKASNCTVYAVANSSQFESTLGISRVNSKADFDKVCYKVLTSAGTPNITNVMFGKKTGYSTTSSTCSIALNKIYSDFSFSIKINKDIKTGLNIVLDSYQLCHLPKTAYISGTMQSAEYYDGKEVKFTSNNESGHTKTFTGQILMNPLPKGTNPNSKGWGYRSGKYAPANASYLKIKAHSQMWETTFYYYLGGLELPSAYSASADYTDYTDYTIYPSKSYKAAITLDGNGAEEDGNRVSVILKSVTAGDLGKIICADGSVYKTVSLAKAAGKEPVGFIAYVGNEAAAAPYNHGIAFALENVNKVGTTEVNYDDAVEIAKTYKGAAMKFSSGWHIPSIEEWNRMFDAFGGTKYGIPDNLDNSLNSQHWDSGNVRQAMLDAGGNAFWGFSNFAAKTTFNGEVGFWVYTFGGSIPDGGLWGWRTNSYPRAVRLCFVF